MMAIDVEMRRRWLKAGIIPAIGILLVLAALPWLFQGKGGDADAAAPNPVVTPTAWTIKIASVHVNAPLVGIDATTSLTLDPPRNPQQVGWWKQSATPGMAHGKTIVTGHTVHTGGGQFDHLDELTKGAEVTIVSAAKTITYRVSRVQKISKADVDKDAVNLFGQKNPHNVLELITCSDWNGHAYLTNTFVWATPIRVAPTAPAA